MSEEKKSAEPTAKLAAANGSPPLLKVRDLVIEFRRHGGDPVQAVRGISFDLAQGESLAIVGESGSGKSATALALARLLPDPPAKITADELAVSGHEVLKMSERQLRKIRGKEIAYVFQEPTTSLNPVLTVRTQIAEALALHRPEVKNRDEEIIQWLYKVGIVEPEKRLRAYPHELSGGMQQRVMIAMALCCQPKLLIADEPTTALDVTIQKQIMDLLAGLRASLSMSMILITHNFGIIRDVADKVAVMFRGRIVESGPVQQVLSNPRHPYTQALLDCVPRMGAKQRRLAAIDYELIDRAPMKEVAAVEQGSGESAVQALSRQEPQKPKDSTGPERQLSAIHRGSTDTTDPRGPSSKALDPWAEFHQKHAQYIPYIPDDSVEYPCEIQMMYSDLAAANRALSDVCSEVASKLKQVNAGPSTSSGALRYHIVHEGRLKGEQFKSFILSQVRSGAELYEAFARGAPRLGESKIKHPDRSVQGILDRDGLAGLKMVLKGATDRARFRIECPLCGGSGNMSGIGKALADELFGGEGTPGISTACLGCDATLTIPPDQVR